MVLGRSPENGQSFVPLRHMSNGKWLKYDIRYQNKTESRSIGQGQQRFNWKSACNIIQTFLVYGGGEGGAGKVPPAHPN